MGPARPTDGVGRLPTEDLRFLSLTAEEEVGMFPDLCLAEGVSTLTRLFSLVPEGLRLAGVAVAVAE